MSTYTHCFSVPLASAFWFTSSATRRPSGARCRKISSECPAAFSRWGSVGCVLRAPPLFGDSKGEPAILQKDALICPNSGPLGWSKSGCRNWWLVSIQIEFHMCQVHFVQETCPRVPISMDCFISSFHIPNITSASMQLSHGFWVSPSNLAFSALDLGPQA